MSKTAQGIPKPTTVQSLVQRFGGHTSGRVKRKEEWWQLHTALIIQILHNSFSKINILGIESMQKERIFDDSGDVFVIAIVEIPFK